MDFLRHMRETRIVPVADIASAKEAVRLAYDLRDAGLRCSEITFRPPAAEDAIRAIAGEVPDVVVGAGTVRTIEQADRAIEAGAKFLVAPGTNAQLVSHAAKLGIPMLPGVCTATEVEQALGMGL